MHIDFPIELDAKLSRVAAKRGVEREALVLEAIEQLVSHEDWFAAEVDKGLAQIERGETLSHAEVGLRIDKYMSNKQPHA